MRARWERFWFEPMRATRLALLRWAVGLWALVTQLQNHRSWVAVGRANVEQFAPTGPATWLDGPLDPAIYEQLLQLGIVLNVLFLLGVCFRVVGPAFGALLVFNMAYRNSWGMIYHVANLWVLHAMVLSVVPATSALSVDSWLERRGTALSWLRWPGSDGAPSWQFGWPVKLVCAVTTITYLLAGIAKVTSSVGWRWALGANLRDQIAYDALYKELIDLEGASTAIWFIYDHPELLIPAATAALVVELLAPLALLHRRVGQAWALSAVGMPWGIQIMMRLTFPYPIYGVAFLSFFPLDDWLDRIIGALRRAPV